jgi:hypothetical protein
VCESIELFVVVFLLTVVLARFFYPIKTRKFRKDQLSALLIFYIATAGEIAEMFSYIDESAVVKDTTIFFFIMGTCF